MKKIAELLFSSRLMAVIFIVFAVSMAFATFIENDFGSETSRAFVYNARWFEILLLLGALNLVGRMFTQNMFTREKLPVLIFHLAFILIIGGAAVTRYTGIEGILSIREGKSSDRFITGQAYISVSGEKNRKAAIHHYPVTFSVAGSTRFKKQFDIHGGTRVQLNVKAFIPNAVKTIEPENGGVPVAELFYADSSGRNRLVVTTGELQRTPRVAFSFEIHDTGTNVVLLMASPDSLSFIAPYPVSAAGMNGESFAILKENIPHRFIPRQLYTFNSQMIVLANYQHSGKVVHRSVPESEGIFPDAVVLEVTSGKEHKMITVCGMQGKPGQDVSFRINDQPLLINYGSVYKTMPFEVILEDFNIERYAGSGSPSAFESHVVLRDSTRKLEKQYTIYMNNILRYRGYRIYQSSYDNDEMGTVLTVNKDFTGTFISYSGYFLLTLGMIISLFSRRSRFQTIAADNKAINRKLVSYSVALTIMLSGFTWTVNAQAPSQIPAIDKEHAERFGRLLIQNNKDRISPVSSLSSDILRKVSRKTNYKGLNPDQVFLGMLAHASHWQYEPIIRASNPEIRALMGSDARYFAYADFFKNNDYVLNDRVEMAFRKKPAKRSKFDNEIIRLNERINICYMIFAGDFLRLFPVPGDSLNKWYNHNTISGLVKTADSAFVENILIYYIQQVASSSQSGDWSSPNQIIDAISLYQEKYAADIIPAVQKQKTETLLNKYDIFSFVSRYYGILGFILLIVQFTGIFYRKLNVNVPVKITKVLLFSLFILHTFGLGLRWYVSGHAPLSNGYEALTYVAWASILAGLIFSRRASITLSITAILAFLILFVAHLGWMDPQITNLAPVLRSYWLIFHVAIITASYGFLAMGALLAFINLMLMILETNTNKDYLNLHIRLFTNTIEMALTIGLYLLTIGVFLGAVWANESWGRYWGWDPKETWALITVIVYAFILHMRLIPGLKGLFAFNLVSLLGISSVIMTYFGVNYYLSGLHSYASGDAIPVPAFIYYSIGTVAVTAIMAFIRQKHLNAMVV